MKRVLMCALATFFLLTTSSFTSSAKDTPAGMRMEIVEIEQNDNEFTIFTYKDKDGDLGYYLGLGNEFRISELLDIEILGGSLGHIDEVCLCLGATPNEASASLNAILSLFDNDVNDIAEFPASLATGAERLGNSTTVTCIVKKKFLGGKYLQFHFVNGKHTAQVDMNKSTLKFLLKGLERDMKK